MTVKQRQARAKFKAVVKEAAKLRKKNPKLTQSQAVKQAFAISYSKQRKGEKLGAVKKKSATKVKAKKRKSTEMHTDTKSHNVNIRVISGFSGNMYSVRDSIEKDIKRYNESIQRIKNEIPALTKVQKNNARITIKKFKGYIQKLKDQLRTQNALIRMNLK